MRGVDTCTDDAMRAVCIPENPLQYYLAPLHMRCRANDDTGANGIKLLCRNGKELDVSILQIQSNAHIA